MCQPSNRRNQRAGRGIEVKPDDWQRKHELDFRAKNHNRDGDGDGYTNIEEYLNGTDPIAKN